MLPLPCTISCALSPLPLTSGTFAVSLFFISRYCDSQRFPQALKKNIALNSLVSEFFRVYLNHVPIGKFFVIYF